MKKLLGIVVLLIFWSNISIANNRDWLESLPKKIGKENDLYNIWIRDYNKLLLLLYILVKLIFYFAYLFLLQ